MPPDGSDVVPGNSSTQALRRVPSALAVPPPLIQPGVEQLDSPTTIVSGPPIPHASFIQHTYDSRKRRIPQCIAHRGYKAKFPENTMSSFKGALEAGAHALETDVHVTKDEIVVLSHDGSLKRCFGVDKKIKDCTWEEIQKMRTIARAPNGASDGESMPKLSDLLEWLAAPEREHVWLLLDIKLDNSAEQIMRLLGDTISSVPTRGKPWQERILLGVWAAKYLPLALTHLAGFPITHIAFSTSYSRHFFTVPNVSFNILLPMLLAPGGSSFLRDTQSQQPSRREVFAWTVNEAPRMMWCIRRQLDGVITDDPPKFLAICESWDESAQEGWFPVGVKGYWDALRVWLWVTVMAYWFKKMFLPVASRELIKVEIKRKTRENGRIEEVVT